MIDRRWFMTATRTCLDKAGQLRVACGHKAQRGVLSLLKVKGGGRRVHKRCRSAAVYGRPHGAPPGIAAHAGTDS